jgi:adenylate cyclase
MKKQKYNKRYTDNIKFSIGTKLILIITVIVLLSLGSITAIVSFMFRNDLQITAEANNLETNRNAARETEYTLAKTRSEAAILMQVQAASDAGVSDAALKYYFTQNPLVAALVFNTSGKPAQLLVNENFFNSRGLEPALAKTWQNNREEALRRGEAMENVLLNESPGFGITPLVSLFFSWQKGGGGVLFIPENLDKSFGSQTNHTFLINNSGDILIYTDSELLQAGENVAQWDFIRKIRESSEREKQSFTDADFRFGRSVSAGAEAANTPTKQNIVLQKWEQLKKRLPWESIKKRMPFHTKDNSKKFFVAFNKLNIGACIVVTGIEYNTVFEGIDATTRRNIYLTFMVLFISIMFIWFFSKSISRPLKALAVVSREIEGGHFEVALSKHKRHDEIGVLLISFQRMSNALGIFGRFTNKLIAIKAMRGEIKPGGLPKHATVFFSDIRSFTAMSENFTKKFGKEASDRIVHWLNEYFTKMVECIEKTGGVVDKFIGDAVMAHWGTAYSAGSPKKDAFNCVKAALMMRSALMKLNKARAPNDPGNPNIQIGCGINTGIVTAGQLGSDLRMEYTVIGDPVNLASRTEALNKPLGTDILITEDTWKLVNKYFITEEMPPVTVKGKEKPVRIFAVVNFIGSDNGPKTLSQVRSRLGIEEPDLSKVDMNGEEKKYKIGGKG